MMASRGAHPLRLVRPRTCASVLAAVSMVAAPALAGSPGGAATGRSSLHPAAVRTVPAPRVAATSALLMDVRTGEVLWARAPDLPRPPASTTKILTALLAAERLRLQDPVTVSGRAEAQRNGSAIGMRQGEVWSVEALLHALLLHSANDAAVALAEAVSGSVEAFAAEMTRRARALGARRSTFVNPHGLHDPGHLTTARDLALIARGALRHPVIDAIVRQPTWRLVRPGQPPVELINRNRLLWLYAGADGVKTGWTAQSGPSLVASATRGGRRLIAVVLNSNEVFGDAARLLDYGFAASVLVRVVAHDRVVVRRPLAGGRRVLTGVPRDDLYVVLPRGAPAPPVVVRLDPGLTLPIRRGARVGAVVVLRGGGRALQVPIVAAADVAALSWWERLAGWLWIRRGREPFPQAAGDGP
ncbi:MAG: D-alanyl-D-alanine carboxypeptidase family protein [Armatimonadota bacterium]|nr:D-alanyl-D-alanine carboxypeptidase family protein [Armatimonadota bacterium]MDR7526912.1 D-alanyl-D-alanine carboxypeptidase family protein [Armatimonadota bacterium]